MLIDGPILVTGGTGYVGRHLLRRLRAEHPDQPVRALVRREGVPLPDGVKAVRGDLTDHASLASAVRGARAVVNLAAVVANLKPPKGGYDAVNADGTAALGRAAAGAGVGVFVQMGGIDRAGESPGPYIAGRRRGERALREAGVPWVLLQPSIQFGGGSPFVTALVPIVRRAPVVPVIGRGDFVIQMIWVEDVLTCLLAAVADPDKQGRAIELGGPEHLTYDRIVELIGEGLGRRRVRKIHMPLGLMRVQIRAMQILPRPPLAPVALELFRAPENATDLDAVPREFGFTPRAMRDHFARHGVE